MSANVTTSGITGMGAITPCGLTADETWANIRAGQSGATRVEGLTMPEGNVSGGQVKGFDPGSTSPSAPSARPTGSRTWRGGRHAGRGGRRSRLAADADRIGCSIGTGIGGLRTQEVAHRKLFEAGPDRLNPFWVTALIPNMAAARSRWRWAPAAR